MKSVGAMFLLLALPGCAAYVARTREEAHQRTMAELQPRADFELRCMDPANLVVLQSRGRRAEVIGASCEDKQVTFVRPPKSRMWYRADQVPPQYAQSSFMRDVAVVGAGVYVGSQLSR